MRLVRELMKERTKSDLRVQVLCFLVFGHKPRDGVNGQNNLS